jgi:hypothetical protein
VQYRRCTTRYHSAGVTMGRSSPGAATRVGSVLGTRSPGAPQQ